MKIMFTCLFFCSQIFLTVSAFALNVGEAAPDFTAINQVGETVQLSDYHQNQSLAIVFYRGGWCPYCNVQLKDYQAHYSEFEKAGLGVVAISVDKAQKVSETSIENKLAFDVLSEPTADALAAYGIVYQVPMKLVKKYKEEYQIDLEADSGQTHHKIAVPAVFIVDPSGELIFKHLEIDYKQRLPAKTVLDEFKKVN